jgi:hypothetical protein
MKRAITVLYDGIKTEVKIKNNHLIVPEGVKSVDCSYNKLKELELPEGVELVGCKE